MRIIVEIENPKDSTDKRLVLWSTVVDAPVSPLMDEDSMFKYVREGFFEDFRFFPERMERVRQTGTSSRVFSRDNLLVFNRAGENEQCLSIQELWDRLIETSE